MTRTYPEAPVCAVGAIVFRGNAVLLIQRAKPPAQGKWSIPGGAVRLGGGAVDHMKIPIGCLRQSFKQPPPYSFRRPAMEAIVDGC